MTCKINLLFVPYHNTGGHFVDWSISYVCGEINHDADAAADNFTHNRNWHQHKSNIVNGFADLKQKVTWLQRESTRQFENIYVLPLNLAHTVQAMHNVHISQSSHDQRNQIIEHIHQDSQQMLQWWQQAQLVPVILDYHEPDLHSRFYNNRYVVDIEQNPLENQQQQFDQLLDLFYPGTRMRFEHTALWDCREMMALMWPFRHKEAALPLDRLYDHQLPHLHYNTDDIWNNFPPVLQEICAILQLDVQPDKFEIWQPIYQQWREVHDPYLGRHLDRIIDAIVHNKYLCLRRFNMNFLCEVLIQNQLIVKHNLNLRTWQLVKFPDNTQDLHQLLEPNIHTL